MIRAGVTASAERAEELRARFLELAPGGFEETEAAGAVELAAYGEAADRVVSAFPGAVVTDVAEGWEDRWREFHHGVTIGSVWVGPPWEEAAPGTLPVVIDPGRAFGTGAHPSTRLALELLHDEERGSLLDIGCGSGVLAIAAAKLGFAPVRAVDVDPVAVEVTRENARANGVGVEAETLDATAGGLLATRVAVANISAGAVNAVGPHLTAERVVTAGYLSADRPVLPGYRHLERREREGWAADLYETAR